MKIDWATITIAVCLTVWFVIHYVVLPMFNAYLEYRRDIRLHEQDMAMYKVQINEKGLQRNNDDPDIKQRSGKSDEGTFLHDEELPL